MAKLTKREKEVVRLLAQGKRQTEIARALVVSPRTIETHLRNARHKAQVGSSFELAVKAIREGVG